MSLLSLPNELLIQISDELKDDLGDFGSFVYTHQWLELLLEDTLIDLVFNTQSRIWGREVMFSAANRGDAVTVRSLLDRGIISFVYDFPMIPQDFLHFAAKTESYTTICTLLACGVPPSVHSRSGETPLCAAAKEGNLGAVKAFIESGKVNINAGDAWNRTPLWLAASIGDEEIVSALLNLENIEVNSCNVDWDSTAGRTPLAIACCLGHGSVVRELLADGRVEVNTQDEAGLTPIHSSVKYRHRDALRLLLSHPSVNILTPCKRGRTPLHTAAEIGNQKAFKKLLHYPQITNPDILAGDDWTPLGLAAWNDHGDIVKALVKDGRADLNRIAGVGQTAIVLAAKRESFWVLEVLLHARAVDVYKRGETDGVSFAEFVERGSNLRLKLIWRRKLRVVRNPDTGPSDLTM
ncbi:unnamed protein product [Tuber aestivum]|uniref:Uncharacterized protein n=1 Tax=Tuber aestivum TaxID=59557 RepID=A0A292PVF4_9PEZI|nr:unnamed protein product [Tuber aestivum]